MGTLNRRVLSNLIEQIKPYISQTVLPLNSWRGKRGRYDGDGIYTVFDGEADFSVGELDGGL